MLRNPDVTPTRHLLLRQFSGNVVQRFVERDEFCTLLLSRRSLERCNDERTHCCGLFDSRSGELFDIRKSDLFSRA